MSYANIPPEATFTLLEDVLRRQRRLLWMGVAAMMTMVIAFVTPLAALL